MIYRHGDLILRSKQRLPPRTQVVQRAVQTFVLAEGETTGHKHLLTAPEDGSLDVIESLGTHGRFLRVNGASQLTHEEHKTSTIEPGLYEIVREREYDYFEHLHSRVRPVVD